MAEFLLAFGVIALSLLGLGIGLLLGRDPPHGSCATAAARNDNNCPVCGQAGGTEGGQS